MMENGKIINMNGKGIYYLANGNRYDGKWKDGKMIG